MRKKRSKFTWMPVNGTTVNTGAGSIGYSHFRIPFTTIPNDLGLPSAQYLFPIVPDYTEQTFGGLEAEPSLRDVVEGQDWVCKRIVGKLALAASGESSGWQAILLHVGIFVAPSADSNEATINAFPETIDVTFRNNAQKSWMFRRTWWLGVPQATAEPYVSLPVHTEGFGDFQSGPHIDVKSSRRIKRNQRLWLIIQAFGADDGVTAGAETLTGFSGFIDLRVLGAMRKARRELTF